MRDQPHPIGCVTRPFNRIDEEIVDGDGQGGGVGDRDALRAHRAPNLDHAPDQFGAAWRERRDPLAGAEGEASPVDALFVQAVEELGPLLADQQVRERGRRAAEQRRFIEVARDQQASGCLIRGLYLRGRECTDRFRGRDHDPGGTVSPIPRGRARERERGRPVIGDRRHNRDRGHNRAAGAHRRRVPKLQPGERAGRGKHQDHARARPRRRPAAPEPLPAPPPVLLPCPLGLLLRLPGTLGGRGLAEPGLAGRPFGQFTQRTVKLVVRVPLLPTHPVRHIGETNRFRVCEAPRRSPRRCI